MGERFCPVCGIRKSKGVFCSNCGFDSSLDYDLYMTLGDGMPDVLTIEEQQKRYRAAAGRDDDVRRLMAYQEQLNQQLNKKQKELQEQQAQIAGLKAENQRMREELKASKEQAQGISKAPAAPVHQEHLSRPLQTGDRVAIGNYKKSREGYKEPVTWKVLKHDGQGHVLLLAEQGLECMKFDEKMSNRWRSCGLRTWLNDSFYNSVFGATDKSHIQTAVVGDEYAIVSPPQTDKWGMNYVKQLRNVYDNVFLLSTREAEDYFPEPESRIAFPTEHAVRRGVNNNHPNRACGWWLRTSCEGGKEAVVAFQGVIEPNGYPTDTAIMAVRPAVWMDAAYAATKMI